MSAEAMWQFSDVDLAKVAESMGCFGIRVTDPAKIPDAIEEALTSNRPAVVDVVSDWDVVAPPPWGPSSSDRVRYD